MMLEPLKTAFTTSLMPPTPPPMPPNIETTTGPSLKKLSQDTGRTRTEPSTDPLSKLITSSIAGRVLPPTGIL
jgi:hypothetical protein